jgi:hypothetical protein
LNPNNPAVVRAWIEQSDIWKGGTKTVAATRVGDPSNSPVGHSTEKSDQAISNP